MSAPKCKRCKVASCAYYGKVGGYSVQCKACNERSGVLRRASYARNHPPTPSPAPSPKFIYEQALAALRKDREIVDNAIEKLEALVK